MNVKKYKMDRISELLYKKIVGEITPDELDELQRWATTESRRRLISSTDDYDMMRSGWLRRSMVDYTRPMEEMSRHISRANRPRRVRRLAVAASVAIVLTGMISLLRNTKVDNVVQEMPLAVVALDDIKPGTVKATLTTSTGETLMLASDDADKIFDHDAYTTAAGLQPIKKIEELSLDVPRGGEYMIVLEDSTKVWLNSQSQLRYPATFADNERRVKVSGEVYFEVKRDENRPFYVETEGQVIRVYGTEFNVKAYEDEGTVYTTLENGSISLSRRGYSDGELYLAPGHQARLNLTDSHIDMMVVDTEAITGWRHGRFVFEEQRLEDIMRDLSRWYDFEYRFEAAQLRDVVFKGSIPRYSDFTTALAIIETSGNISFAMDNGVVVIDKKETTLNKSIN